ncbi:MAG: tetratricopeptide repeat protein [Moorea sp. SIO2B7]|nr:tetratricopeptide repeat protein [Moorena sp. SIO2B7]
MEHHRAKRLLEAETCFYQVLQQQPDNSYANFNLALVYQDQGDQIKALQYYQKAIQIKPDFAEAYNNLGNLYLKFSLRYSHNLSMGFTWGL